MPQMITCAKCHEKGGSSADDDAGILAGQWTHYLKEQFAAFRSGKRQMDEKMKPKIEKLSEEADEVHLLMNNCYGDKAVRNAAELAEMLAKKRDA